MLPWAFPFTSWQEWDTVEAMEQTQEGLRLRQVLTDYFDKHEEILLARLFGSVAQGRETAKSDVDVAVCGMKPLTAEQLVSMQQDLESLCGREVDLSDLQAAEGLFLYKIMTKGCPLKHQPEIHHHYAMKALCFYEDFYPLVRRMQLERVRRFCNG